MLAFHRTYEDWTEVDWANAMYSNESMFQCIPSVKSKMRRPSGSNHFNPYYTFKTVKHSNPFMVWGRSSAKRRGGIYFMLK